MQKIIIEKTFNDGYLGSLIDEEHGKMWKVMWNAELCESLNCWIQIVPVEFSSTSIHVWVLDFYLLKKIAFFLFFSTILLFTPTKKGKRKKEKLKKEKKKHNLSGKRSPQQTFISWLFLTSKKEKHFLWLGGIHR